jgi:hypothetical protein
VRRTREDWGDSVDFWRFLEGKFEHLGRHELAEEMSGQFEGRKIEYCHLEPLIHFSSFSKGDIVISQTQMDELSEMRRIGHRDTKYRWTNGIIPYKIAKSFCKLH